MTIYKHFIPAFLLCGASLPWLLPAAGFLYTVRKRGYSPYIGALTLVLMSFIGLAGLVGPTALRPWMIGATLLAPIVLWIGSRFLPENQNAQKTSILPAAFFILLWGCWLAWNAFLFEASVGLRSSTRHQILGRLATLRGSIQLYQQDGGALPRNLDELTSGRKYLDDIFEISAITTDDRILHAATSHVTYFATLESNDAGGWGYVNNPASRDFGKVFINCTHTDMRDTAWWTY